MNRKGDINCNITKIISTNHDTLAMYLFAYVLSNDEIILMTGDIDIMKFTAK